MTRVAFRGIAREHLIAVAIAILVSAFCLLLSGIPAHGADASSGVLKPYSPFDEPRPAVPQEMLSDKRLDLKVRVHSRSNNLRALLDDLSRVSSVKLSVEPKLQAEHPLVFFRSRPLRDVMSELSRLYGYTWYAKPDRGGYRYELIEDAPHAKSRVTLAREGRQRSDALLLDFTRKYLAVSPDDEKVKQFAWTNNNGYQALFGSSSAYTRKLLSSAGEDLLARGLADSGVTIGFSEAPSALQTAVCDYINAMNEMGRRWRSEQAPAATTPVDPASMASGKISIRRADGSSSSFPRFEFSITAPSGSTNTLQWPSYQLRYEDLSTIAGWDGAQSAPGAQALPNDIMISPPIPKTRLWLTTADMLQAIAEQSGRDVIADNIQQDQQQPLVAGVPLGTLIETICREQAYACQADDSILRLRFSQWYAQPLPQEPPTDLIASCWKDLEKQGRLSMADMVALASLPAKQMQWRGFREMPGASNVLRSADAFRLWASLTDAKVSADGLAVSKLSQDQKKLFDGWLASRSTTLAPEELSSAVLTVTTERPTSTGGYGSRTGNTEYQQLSVKAGDKVLLSQPIFLPSPMSDDDRNELVETRKVDRESDVITVVK